jgi:soluble lytic murein transglycosylase-like protein
MIAASHVLASCQSTERAGQASSSPLGVASRWRPCITEASDRFGIPPGWIAAVIRAESGGRLLVGGRPITSRAGAMGLMQLMPATWSELRSRYRLGPDPYAPRDNILAGAAYLRILYIRYGYPRLFAAYNAGPARLDGLLAARRPLPRETQAYLASLGQPPLAEPHAARATQPALFFRLQTAGVPDSRQAQSGFFESLSPQP